MSGRFTSLILLGVSLFVWLVGALFDTPVNSTVFGFDTGNVMSRCITFVCFALSSLMLSQWYVFDRRIRWLMPLSFSLASVSLFVHGCVEYSISLLLQQYLICRLFECDPVDDNRYTIFSIFFLLGVAIMVFPQFVMLLPLSLIYLFMLSLAGVREILALLLGLLLPFWFFWGIGYIFPWVTEQMSPVSTLVGYVMSVGEGDFSLFEAVVGGVGLLVIIPFIAIFSGSSVPAKPVLRKRLRCLVLTILFLMSLSVLYDRDFTLYYIWSLPILSVMLAYIYTVNVSRFSRYYFIFINIIWLLMVPFSLWLKHL